MLKLLLCKINIALPLLKPLKTTWRCGTLLKSMSTKAFLLLSFTSCRPMWYASRWWLSFMLMLPINSCQPPLNNSHAARLALQRLPSIRNRAQADPCYLLLRVQDADCWLDGNIHWVAHCCSPPTCSFIVEAVSPTS